MIGGRPRQLARGLSALAGLVVLVAGVPAALVVLAGWPLPHSLPSVDAVRQALEQGWSPDGAVVLKALAVVCWAAWAELAVCVVVEVAAARRGRRPARVPLAGPLQPLVAHLVAVVLVSLGPAAPAGSLAPGAPPLTAAVARYGTPVPALRFTAAQNPPKTMASASPASPAAAAPKQVVVRPRDNLWDLAERHLGNPLRWREIWELNRSRLQPDGRPLINPDLIRSGWTLLLPPDALGADVDTPPSVHRHGPSLLASPAPVTSPGDLRAPPPAPHGRPGATEPSPAPDQGTEPAPAPDPGSRPPVPAPVRLPSGSTVAASFAAGVAAAVATGRLRRRRSWRPSRPGPAVLTPPPDLGPAVRTLLRAGTPPQAAEPGTTDANPVEPPPLFPYAGLGDPAPARLPIGARGSRPVELELTGLGGLGIDGPGAPDVVRALVAALMAKGRAYVTELIVPAPTAQRLLPGAPAVAGVRTPTDLDAALAEVEIELIRRTRLLAAQEAADFAAYRQACPEDLLPALVLIVDEVSGLPSGRLRAVAELGSRLGVGVIVCGAEGWCPARISVDGQGVARDVSPEPLAATLSGAVLHRLTDAECAEVLGVLAVARTEEPVAPEGRTDAGEQGGEPSATPDTLLAEHAGPLGAAASDPVQPSPMPRAGSAVRVQLLGPYRIEAGGDELRTGLRTAARELLAFYLLRPQGAGVEAAVDALWPEVELHRGSERFWTALGNLRSRIRQATGVDQPLIEKVGERYRVQPGVFDVDLWRFQEALAEAGGRLPDDDAEAALASAARAYGGELLEGSFYEWAEPVRQELRRRALDALARLADIRAGRGDKEGELAAVEQAIGVDPYAEEPYRRAIVLLQELDRVDVARQLFRQLGVRLADLDADPAEETLQALR